MILLNKEQLKNVLRLNKAASKSYTYGLCKLDGGLFYVGVGTRNRVTQHTMNFELEKSNNRLKANTTAKSLKQGGLLFVIFCFHENRNYCLKLEADLISKFGRIDNNSGILTNLTDGGEIGPSGVKVSEKTRMKLSEVRKEMAKHLSSKNKEYWEKLPEEERSKILEKLHSNKADPNLLSEIQKAKWTDPDYRNRMSEIQRESQKLCADVHKANMKAKWADPAFREWMLLRRKLAKENKAKSPV